MGLILENNFETVHCQQQKINSIVDVFLDCDGEKQYLIDANEEVTITIISINSNVTISIKQPHDHSTIHIETIIIGTSQNKKVFLQSELQHSHTKATMNITTLLGNNAKITLEGGITIYEGLSQCEGFLHEENLILGKNIEIKALPKLDIKSNDVKASHGASIQNISPQHLFYFQSKGISYKGAKDMIVEGYLTRILQPLQESNDAKYCTIKKKIHTILNA